MVVSVHAKTLLLFHLNYMIWWTLRGPFRSSSLYQCWGPWWRVRMMTWSELGLRRSCLSHHDHHGLRAPFTLLKLVQIWPHALACTGLQAAVFAKPVKFLLLGILVHFYVGDISDAKLFVVFQTPQWCIFLFIYISDIELPKIYMIKCEFLCVGQFIVAGSTHLFTTWIFLTTPLRVFLYIFNHSV